MHFDSKLNNVWLRALVLLCLLAGCGWLTLLVASQFVVRSLSDWRVLVSEQALALAVASFPDSALLNARLSEVELSALEDREAAISRADLHAARAVAASPFDYRYRVLRASARESLGDRSGAEAALREAVRLAPGNADVRWRLANLLVRAGKIEAAATEFQTAVTAQPERLPGALELIWNVSNGDQKMIAATAGAEPVAQLTLAQFLLHKSQPAAAINTFRQLSRESRLTAQTAAPSAAFISALLTAGLVDEAWREWRETLAFSTEQLLADGDFEADIPQGFTQFAWQFGQSDQARIRVIESASDATGSTHSGRRALRIDFTGRNSTTLNDEIRHPFVVAPGATYRVECFVRTKDLVTPEGPRIAVISGQHVVAESAPVTDGSSDWQKLSFDFTAPVGARLLHLTVRRQPKFGYDDPTRGAVWLDDFSVSATKRDAVN